MPRIKGEFASGRVWINSEELFSASSLKVRNHSPTGFSWGYGGSGPAQLALAILMSYFPREIALRHYQDFKWRTIARLPQSDFEIELNIYDMVDIGEILSHSTS